MVAMAVVAVTFGIALLAIQLAGLPEGAGHGVAVTGYVVIIAVALVVRRVADRAAKAVTEQP
jgi:hypothetical protein